MGMIKEAFVFKPRLQVIDSDQIQQIQQIHGAALDVLERRGGDIPHDRALEMLSGNGARLDGHRMCDVLVPQVRSLPRAPAT